MPKTLPAAAVGALAAGLTMPFAASAADAAPAPAAPQPLVGSADMGASSSLPQTTVLTASSSSGQFVQPLTGSYTFSTGYGPRCSPTPGALSHHLGQDLVAPKGTSFRAIAAGTVVSTQDGTSSRAGHVMVRHNIGGKTYHSRYLHIWEGESHVSVGDTVQAGDAIGLVGNSGVASTPHLHLEIWEGAWHSGTALDPHTFLSERGVDMRGAAAGESFPSQCDDSSGAGGSEPAGDSSGSSSSVSNSSSSSGSSGETRRVTEPLYLRSGAGNTHGVIGGMAAGEQVTVSSTSGDWVQVRRSNGQTGWAHGAYLRSSSGGSSSSGTPSSGSSGSSSTGGSSASGASDSSSSSSSSGSSSSGSSSQSGSSGSSSGSGDRVKVTDGVNMRSGPSLSSRVDRIVPAGSSVEVLDRQGGWHQVRANGNTGWVWEDFLDVSSGSSGSGSSSSGSSGSPSSSSSSSGGSSSSSSSSSGSSSSDGSSSGSSGSSNSSSGSSSSSGRGGPSSGQHRQSSHGPYSSAWDRLAQCESGGNWSINTGNGYYGGLQFSESSWRSVGGSGLPHQASKQEQIQRAYQLWQRQGWGAWPSCSQQLGLSGDPGGWGDTYFNAHSGTQTSSSSTSSPGQWQATYSVPLREGPNADSDKLAQIPRGEVLRTGQSRGSWIQVEYDDAIGWVNTAFIASV